MVLWLYTRLWPELTFGARAPVPGCTSRGCTSPDMQTVVGRGGPGGGGYSGCIHVWQGDIEAEKGPFGPVLARIDCWRPCSGSETGPERPKRADISPFGLISAI